MNNAPILISTGTLTRQSLAGQVALVTGAGRGIGYEAARALSWMGARVVIAEIDKKNGKEAQACINTEMGWESALFIHTDLGDEGSLRSMAHQATSKLGKVDIVLNNATIGPMGAVKDRPIKDWDASYRVNLRAPVLLAQIFLPGMLVRNYGVFVCVSSVGGAYMSAYECFKIAQVELANTLDAELEGTGVNAFTIGPGQALTPGFRMYVKDLAAMYGKTFDEFVVMNQNSLISVEAAGAGFAAAIALSPRFRGLETGSLAGLMAAGINYTMGAKQPTGRALSVEAMNQALALCCQVRGDLGKQASDWEKRNVFERKYMQRDFRQNTGLDVNDCLKELEALEKALEAHDGAVLSTLQPPLAQIDRYYAHYMDMAKSYLSDPQKLEEATKAIREMQDPVRTLKDLLGG